MMDIDGRDRYTLDDVVDMVDVVNDQCPEIDNFDTVMMNDE